MTCLVSYPVSIESVSLALRTNMLPAIISTAKALPARQQAMAKSCGARATAGSAADREQAARELSIAGTSPKNAGDQRNDEDIREEVRSGFTSNTSVNCFRELSAAFVTATFNSIQVTGSASSRPAGPAVRFPSAIAEQCAPAGAERQTRAKFLLTGVARASCRLPALAQATTSTIPAAGMISRTASLSVDSSRQGEPGEITALTLSASGAGLVQRAHREASRSSPPAPPHADAGREAAEERDTLILAVAQPLLSR